MEDELAQVHHATKAGFLASQESVEESQWKLTIFEKIVAELDKRLAVVEGDRYERRR